MLKILKTEYISRLLTVLLAVTVCFGFTPDVFAMESSSGTETSEEAYEEEIPEDSETEEPKVTSGSCGANLSWEFSGGTLSVTGSGEMTNFSSKAEVPWGGLREEILNVVFQEGITSIGNHAFYECRNITAVVIPGSVTRIGDFAFSYCSGMKIVNFGSGVKTIGNECFLSCTSIASLNLPDSLISIDRKAFYRCESITSVVVPSGVTSIGVSAFGYCKNLVSAVIRANISKIPMLLFSGCEKLSQVTIPDEVDSVGDGAFKDCSNLTAVYYNGENITPEELEDEIGGMVAVSEGNYSGQASGSTTTDNGDGTYTSENTTVVEGEDSTVSTTTETTVSAEGEATGSSDTEISASISGEKGWEESVGVVEDIIGEHGTADDGSEKHIDINLFLQGTETVDVGFIEMIAGKDVTVKITTENGSVWVINGKDINVEELSGNYSLAYVLEAGSAELCEKLGASSCFVLRFLAPAEINAEVMIRIGGSYARRNATLFQNGKEVSKVQSAVVDNEGYAHFYLGSVTEKTEYYIGMDIAGASGEAIVPQNMLAEYGNPEYIEPIKYEITGRTSSWGMNLGQVMSILAVVMVSVIVVVGAVMFFWNRQRLKNGYVPQMDDDE
ncbi:MAG: leucine-rich repeat protein [Oscillospiraceae bacterium]|nr:leucine-rich repeat protein [Oscillospiraceae bacterium]